MALLTVSDLRKDVNGEPLFERVSFSVERRDRVALSGPNGAGKTTLLRLVAGESEPDGGTLALRKGTRVSLHDQRAPRERHLSLREYVLSGADELVALEGELRRLERAMSDGRHDVDTLRRYSTAQAELEHAGGYAWRDRGAAIARGVGFANRDLDRPLETLSGGELTRASLARALSADADLLLLDEPTNHLDVEAIEWLERELASLDAAVLLVAHDRWFLEAVTNATLELEAGRSTYFRGPWHAWRREKAERAVHAQKTADRAGDDIARLERFVERFRSQKTKAKQAQAKLTQIARLENERAEAAAEAALLSRRRRALAFEFPQPPRSGRTVVDVRDVRIAAGETLLLDRLSFTLERGEHVALVGPNGSGKTTLVETIVGRRQPLAGFIRLGHGVVPTYYSQNEVDLDESQNLLEAVGTATGLPRPQAQALLGRFLFSGWDEQTKAVGALSGGERRRLALALAVVSGANLLLLDEPTNHLDLES
ncbi:MAG: ATP-binding cassette domain-containing protein, partial [Actinomycetota bacterium]|nr:ATP-binding cassette domain-containing protein [Actinomycetota bacterium]